MSKTEQVYLSKSKYCNGITCPKTQWMAIHMPEEFDRSVLNEAILEQGSEVGDLAMGLFGDYVEVPFGNLSEMIKITQDLMEKRTPVIAEASFSYDGCFCSADILVRKAGNAVELYEVKSSTAVKEINFHDAAYQYWVLTKCGWNVKKVFLVHLNTQYERNGELDLKQLFTAEDVTKTAKKLAPDIEEKIRHIREVASAEEEPYMPIGEYCFSPYDCGYYPWCSRNLPKPNVFDLGGMQLRKKVEYYDAGVVSFEDLLKQPKLGEAYRMQVEHVLHPGNDHIDREGIAAFLKEFQYPLYFLDFESFQPAIPVYDHTHPYQQIVFQYSLHIRKKPGGKLIHKEYLAMPGEDPRRSVAEHLCKDIPADGSVVVYNQTFEKTRLREMANLFPDLADGLLAIADHIVDLIVPFRKRMYYSAPMMGSYSIKKVLPALYPDDPELDYHSLDGVHNGAEASAAFTLMQDMDAEELQKNRENLLKYCGLDTLAMVKLFDRLEEAAKTE